MRTKSFTIYSDCDYRVGLAALEEVSEPCSDRQKRSFYFYTPASGIFCLGGLGIQVSVSSQEERIEGRKVSALSKFNLKCTCEPMYVVHVAKPLFVN